MSFKINPLVVASGGIAFLAAGWIGSVFFTPMGSQSSIYAVELVPQGNAGTLRVNKTNQCKNNGHEGCLLFEQDKVGLIKFYLVGSKYKVETCPKAKSVITRIELTTTVDSTVANDEKGEFTGNLQDWIRNDAFPGVDQDSGIVYESDWDVARTQAWLVNMNSHDSNDGEKRFWYRVTATDCQDQSKQWITDPRGDNEGTKK